MHLIIYKNLVPISQKTNCISITKTAALREIIILTFVEFEMVGTSRMYKEIRKLHRMLAKILKGTQHLGENHGSKDNVKVNFNMGNALTCPRIPFIFGLLTIQ